MGNFGTEIAETLLAKHFDGPVMFVAVAEEQGDNLIQGRGDAYCGMLNASYNLKLRGVRPYIPEYPIGTAEEIGYNQPQNVRYRTENPFSSMKERE